MRKLFLHIGCGKTGSSALQVWLSQNAKQLEESGVCYPLFGSRITDDYKVTSGNGAHAVKALQKNKAKEFFLKLFSENSCDMLLSSEAFQLLDAEEVLGLKQVLCELGVAPVVIVYVRDLVDILNSGYSQLVKRRLLYKKFDDYVLSLGSERKMQQFKVVDLWSAVFPDIVVLHYDSEKKSGLDRAFLSALNLKGGEIPLMKKEPVNRSLTLFELELLRYFNELCVDFGLRDGSRFSKAISDELLSLSPCDRTAIIYNKKIHDHLEMVYGQKLKDFNLKFFDGGDVLKIFRGDGKKVVDAPPVFEVDDRYKVVVRALVQGLVADK